MRDTSPYSGKTVPLRAEADPFGGQEIQVADWYENTAKRLWRDALADGDPKAEGYNIRRAQTGLPDDDDVLFARVDGVMQIVHLSEVEGAQPAAVARSAARVPQQVHARAVGQKCPACGIRLDQGDLVAPVVLGPGPSPKAREAARAGRPYEAVVIEVHWSCATGQEL